jgi:ribosomal protein S27AE
MIDNLKKIKQSGIDDFLKNQREKYECPRCGGVICVHNRKCYDCETIESWRG